MMTAFVLLQAHYLTYGLCKISEDQADLDLIRTSCKHHACLNQQQAKSDYQHTLLKISAS